MRMTISHLQPTNHVHVTIDGSKYIFVQVIDVHVNTSVLIHVFSGVVNQNEELIKRASDMVRKFVQYPNVSQDFED